MTLETLINMTISNGNYTINESIDQTKAKVSIAVGSKEIKSMKVSANLLHKKITGSKLYMCHGLKHGELSILEPERFISILLN